MAKNLAPKFEFKNNNMKYLPFRHSMRFFRHPVEEDQGNCDREKKFQDHLMKDFDAEGHEKLA